MSTDEPGTTHVLTIETVCTEIGGLARIDLERWIERAWVRPDGAPGSYAFREIDVARTRLIHELRAEMRVNDDAVPLVLSLMDQLYEERRRMRRLRDALDDALSEQARQTVLRRILEA